MSAAALDPAVPDVRWDTEPRLIVGWRAGKALAGRRISIDQSVFEDLRIIARETLLGLRSSQPRPYEPHAALANGEEHFTVPTADLPARQVPARPSRRDPAGTPPVGGTTDGTSDTNAAGVGSAAPATASLLAITGAPDALERVDASRLDEHSYLFYGLVFDTTAGSTATFIRKADPVLTARRARVNLAGRGALRRTRPPTLTLVHGIDIVATASHLLVLRKSSFDAILNDVKVALQDVPANLERTVAALAATVPLNGAAVEAVGKLAAARPTYAVRLRGLPRRLASIDVTPQKVRERLEVMGNRPSDLLDGDEFSFPADRVGLFLDLLEGRHFDDEWTGERMKADRMSRHTPS